MEKRFYRWCMYGGYHPDFDLGSGKPFLSRFKAFCSKVAHRIILHHKNAIRAISMPLAGAILIFTLGIMITFQGCKPKQVIVEREKVVYVTKDSIVNRDSVVYVPVEIYKDYSRLTDTLVMSTSLATAKAWNDTVAWTINGLIENKQAVQYQYVEIDKWHTKDSIVEREKPVPYEVEVVKTHIPTWAWLCLVWVLVCLGYGIWRIYKRFFI